MDIYTTTINSILAVNLLKYFVFHMDKYEMIMSLFHIHYYISCSLYKI